VLQCHQKSSMALCRAVEAVAVWREGRAQAEGTKKQQSTGQSAGRRWGEARRLLPGRRVQHSSDEQQPFFLFFFPFFHHSSCKACFVCALHAQTGDASFVRPKGGFQADKILLLSLALKLQFSLKRRRILRRNKVPAADGQAVPCVAIFRLPKKQQSLRIRLWCKSVVFLFFLT